MSRMVGSRRGLLRTAATIAAAALVPAAAAADSRTVTDATGRAVAVPPRIRRVFAAGPPASILLYVLAPDLLLGWPRAPTPQERAYLARPYDELPALGRLTGRGEGITLEALLALGPDLILDVGSTGPRYAALAQEVQARTGIPYLLLDGALTRSGETLRRLGDILGRTDRAEMLAQVADSRLSEARQAAAMRPPSQRPRVYYARGPRGLETALAGSINTEALALVGAENVATAPGPAGVVQVSLEQVLAWNPGVILTQEPTFYAAVRQDPLWGPIDAVRQGRVYLAPKEPFGWFDFPPSVNRLIGLEWLPRVLFPDEAAEGDLAAAVALFYRRFYQVELSAPALAALLGPATGRP